MGLLRDKVIPGSYKMSPWSIEEPLDKAMSDQSEAIFSIGNGCLGIRGVTEECSSDYPGAGSSVFMNGVFQKTDISYHEKAHGFAEASDSRVPVPDATKFKITIDGEDFLVEKGSVKNARRYLDYRTGELIRQFDWESPTKKLFKFEFKRIVLLGSENVAIFKVAVSSVNYSGDVYISGSIDARFDSVVEESGEYDPRIHAIDTSELWKAASFNNDSNSINHMLTLWLPSSSYNLAVGMGFECSEGAVKQIESNDYFVDATFKFQIKAGGEVDLTKYVSYSASREFSDDLVSKVDCALKHVIEIGYDHLLKQQKNALDDFWDKAILEVKGAPDVTSALRFNALQLFFACGRNGKTSISAKGQTGEGYEGHYFWDAEILCLPFLLFTQPDIAKSMLSYRYSTLDKAREISRLMGHKKGALFPWRTISGRECSAYFPAGTAQYHINADIAYAIKKYFHVTGDIEFIKNFGAEMLWESARIWLEIGFFNHRNNGEFVINSVTGPDEYTAIVNNNFYTNFMAKIHLNFAVEIFEGYSDIEDISALAKRIGLSEAEVQRWKLAASLMYLPYDENLGIHKQDDSFLEKELWDFTNTPKENYPLLLHYHPLTIYRHQVSKQADAVLALVLEPEAFEDKVVEGDYNYYKNICVHDSTLSPCAHSIVAARVGNMQEAVMFFENTAFVDIENLHQNTAHGLHMAAMGGGWMSVVYGFAQMVCDKDVIKFSPKLPANWEGYSFRVSYKGAVLEVCVEANETIYRHIDGGELAFCHFGEKHKLYEGENMSLSNSSNINSPERAAAD